MQLYDISAEIYSAHEDTKHTTTSSRHASTNKVSISQRVIARLHRLVHLSVQAAPAIVKSAVMGGILFSSFENLEEYFYQQWKSHHIFSDSSSGGGGMKEDEELRVLFPTVFALGAGGASGCLHGISYTSWDAIGTKFKQSKYFSTPTAATAASSAASLSANMLPFRSLLVGTMLSHALVHGALFGSYELAKRSSLVLIGLNTERDTSRVEGQ